MRRCASTEELARTLQRSDTPTKLQVSHGHERPLGSYTVRLGGTLLMALLLLWYHSASPTTAHLRLSSQRRQDMSLMPSKRAAQLNVLYIVLEDFGVLGTSVFKAPGGVTNDTTPNLARLAGRGTAFHRAYAQVPICNPSRSSLLVGRRPSYTGIFSNEDPFDSRMPPATPTLVDFLRAADPRAVVACGGGKLFHEACDAKARGFSVVTPGMVQGRQQLSSTPATNDEQKVAGSIALLRMLARNSSRFFLGVGLSSTRRRRH